MVNTASVSGLGGDWGAAFYCATKGAVVNFTTRSSTGITVRKVYALTRYVQVW